MNPPDLSDPPERYWHCLVRLRDQRDAAVANNLSFAELERTILQPWHAGRPFSVAGAIIRPGEQVVQVRVVHTPQPQEAYAAQHNARMDAAGITDMATDRRTLPFSEGRDFTYELFFEGKREVLPEPSIAMVESLCRRLPQAARVLSSRTRREKAPFDIEDEYDVQDLLHAIIRAHLKYSVQEDPLPKVAGARSGRADISIEELGVLIEVKFVRRPDDQRRIFEEFSQDLVLYAQWPHLKTLLYLIYNSSDLKDPETLEKLGGTHS